MPLLWGRAFSPDTWSTPYTRFFAFQVEGPGAAALITLSTVATVAAVALLAGCGGGPGGTGTPAGLALVGLLGLAAACLLILPNKTLSPQYLLWIGGLLAALGAVAPDERCSPGSTCWSWSACVLTQVSTRWVRDADRPALVQRHRRRAADRPQRPADRHHRARDRPGGAADRTAAAGAPAPAARPRRWPRGRARRRGARTGRLRATWTRGPGPLDLDRRPAPPTPRCCWPCSSPARSAGTPSTTRLGVVILVLSVGRPGRAVSRGAGRGRPSRLGVLVALGRRARRAGDQAAVHERRPPHLGAARRHLRRDGGHGAAPRSRCCVAARRSPGPRSAPPASRTGW